MIRPIPDPALYILLIEESRLKRTWQIVVPMLMIVLLTITIVGVVCHHHENATSAANCTLCHMAIKPALGGAGQCGFVLRSSAIRSRQVLFLSRLSASEASPRAPPA